MERLGVESLIGCRMRCADQAAPTARLAREKDVVFVVPRFRMGPLGFLPRLLLNDTRPVIKNSSGFTVPFNQPKRSSL